MGLRLWEGVMVSRGGQTVRQHSWMSLWSISIPRSFNISIWLSWQSMYKISQYSSMATTEVFRIRNY